MNPVENMIFQMAQMQMALHIAEFIDSVHKAEIPFDTESLRLLSAVTYGVDVSKEDFETIFTNLFSGDTMQEKFDWSNWSWAKLPTTILILPNKFLDKAQKELGPNFTYVPVTSLSKKEEEVFDLESEVRRAISRRTELDQMFTAHDIKSDLRTKFPNEKIFHTDVRDLVHGLFNNQDVAYPVGWTRTSAIVDANGTYAQVYHSLGQNPDDYYTGPQNPPSYLGSQGFQNQPIKTQAPAQLFPNPYGVGIGGRVVTKTPNRGNVLTPDSKGRIRIGKQQLEEAGFAPGDTVYVLIKPEDKDAPVKIFSDTHKNNRGCVPKKVDEYGNIRLGLKKKGVQGSKFVVDVRGTPDPSFRTPKPNQKGTWLEVKVN